MIRKLLKTEYLFLAALFCMPLYLIRFEYGYFKTNLFELFMLLAIAAYIVRKRAHFSNIEYSWLPKSFLYSSGLIFFGIISSILANGISASGLGILKSWFIIPFAFSFLLSTCLYDLKRLECVYLAIYLSASFVAIVSIIYKILGFLTYDNRLEAFYLSPNYLAMYLAPGIFFGAYFLQKTEKNIWKYLNFSLIGSMLISLYFTYSYSAWIAVAVAVSLVQIAMTKRNWLNIASVVIVLSLLISSQIHAQKFRSSFDNFERSSANSRLIIWKSASKMLAENFLFGIGPGNFQTKYLENQKFFPPYLEWAVPQPHNLFLAFWLQCGLTGFAGLLLLLILTFRFLFQIIRENKRAAFAAPLIGFFIYTSLHGLLDTPYWKNDLSVLFWTCIFLSFSLTKIDLAKN